RRFMNRVNGDVRMGLEKAPSPQDDWAEIQPIPEEAQKSWLRDFLDHSELAGDGNLRELLCYAYSFVKLPTASRKHQSSPYGTWNSLRTDRVVQVAYEWCGTHPISWQLVAQEKAARAQRTPQQQIHPVPSAAAPGDGERERILAVLARMPPEEL